MVILIEARFPTELLGPPLAVAEQSANSMDDIRPISANLALIAAKRTSELEAHQPSAESLEKGLTPYFIPLDYCFSDFSIIYC